MRSIGHRLGPLLVIAGVVMVLADTGALPLWTGLPHLVALPPLDLYTDLGVILTRAPSWPWFAGVLIVVLTVRVLVLALLMGGLDAARVRFAALFYGLALVPALIAAELDYIAFALLYGRLFWVTVLVVVVLLLLVGALPWHGMPTARAAWARSGREGFRTGVLAGYLVALLLIGMIAERWPYLVLGLVPVSAAATALTVRLLARPNPWRARARLSGAAGALVVVAGVVAVAVLVPADVSRVPPRREGSVVFMSGINSASGGGAVFRIDPRSWGYDCAQVYYFSYAGAGDGQPRGTAPCQARTGAPFTPAHTHRSPGAQAALLAAQVRDLPRPLVMVGHSYSAWVAWYAVSRGLVPEVDALVLAGALPASAHGYLPLGGRGQGVVASDLLRLLAPAASARGFPLNPDAPAFRSMLGDRDGPARVLNEPLPEGVRALSVIAAGDLPLLPSGWRLPFANDACPALVEHADLPDSSVMAREVNRFLDGAPEERCPAWRTWGAPLGRPFGVPPSG